MAIASEWVMRGPPTATTVPDGYGQNTATIQSGSLGTLRAGPGGNFPVSVDFDGSATAFDITAMSTPNDADYSILVVALLDVTATAYYLGADGSATPHLRSQTNLEVRWRHLGGPVNSYVVPALGTGVWHSILCTHEADDDAIDIYFDGVQSSTTGNTSDLQCAFTTIGKSAAGNVHNGGIALVRLYDSNESANAVAIHNEMVTGNSDRINYGPKIATKPRTRCLVY